MEPHPWGHRHPDDPRTSTRWVQLTNHSPCIAVSNEVRALSSKPMWSHWWLDSRSCLSRSLHVLHYNQCCFHLNPTVTKVNISTCFIIQCLCLTSWKTKSIYFVLFFSPHYWLYWFSLWLFGSCFCFLLFFAMRVCVFALFFVFFLLVLSIWLYWVISFPLAYGGLLLLLLLRQPLWLFDCMETRFRSSVTDAANNWRETVG